MKQTLDAIRVQLINWPLRYVLPVGLLVLVFLFNLATFAINYDVGEPGDQFAGAVLAIYLTAGVTHLPNVLQGFPFALGLSITRRAFFTGAVLIVVAEALAYGVLMLLFSLVEQATGGWGLQMQFFALPWIRDYGLAAQWLIYAAPFVMFSLVFAFVGAVFKRWGQPGIWVFTLATTALFGGLAVLITWQQQWWWPVLQWLVTQPSTVTLGAYPLLLAVLAGAAGWLVLRRSTP
jgi:hypothetical protein